jgi:hypothetical protein
LGQVCPGSEQEGPARVAQCPHERRSGARGRCLVWGVLCQVPRSCWNSLFVLGRVSAQSAEVWGATQTGSADGSRPTAAKRARVSASLDAEHFQSTRQRRVPPRPLIRVELLCHGDAELSRHNLVFGGVEKTHDHDAVMRISGEAPGGGTILWNGESQVPPR